MSTATIRSVILALAALGVAAAGAVLTGRAISPITGGVEVLSAGSATLLANVVRAFPLGYALGAGMVAAVNPCGFALLPTYLGLYLGANEGAAVRVAVRLRRAVVVSAAVTASFVVLFGAAGLLLSVAAAAIAQYLPWAGLGIGVLLIIVAARLLGGGSLYATFGERIADRIGAGAPGVGVRAYFAYGLAYGVTSLSCTLPIFLAVVGTAVTGSGVLQAGVQFALFAAGMGLVITALTLAAAVLKHAAFGRLRSAVRYVEPASAVLLLVAGAFLVYYWLTVGGLLNASLDDAIARSR